MGEKQQNTNNTQTLQLNKSAAYNGKLTIPGLETRHCKKHDCYDTCWAFGGSFHRTTLTLVQLEKLIREGRAFALGYFDRDYRKKDYWVSSQLLGIDLDECPLTAPELAALPFIRDNAYLIYPTASDTPEQPKNRIIFVTSDPVTDPGRWVTLQVELIHRLAELNIKPDKACKDLARFFYGSTKPGMIILGNVLSADIENELIAAKTARDEQIALLRKQTPARPIAANSTKAERIAASRLNRILDTLGAATTDRHKALITAAGQSFGLLNGGWPVSAAEIERGIMDACARNGYVSKVGEREIERCMNDMRSATPTPLEIHESKTSRRAADKRLSHHRINGAKTESETAQAVDYVSDDLTSEQIATIKNLLIIAPTGMGKTTVAASYGASLPADTYLTGIAQFRLLVDALGDVLQAHHYKESSAQYQAALGVMQRLVSSISSLHKFAERAPGVVILDEIEGDLQFILSSKTFQKDEALIAWRALKTFLQNAEQVIGMDANTSDITIDLLNRWLGNVTVKRYSRAAQARKVIALNGKYEGIYQIEKLLGHGRGAVYAGIASEKLATEIADSATEKSYRVIKITSDTSHTKKVQDFIKNAHNERDEYDLCVYDTAAGAGVDFSNKIYAQVCIFDAMPLAPEQGIQLFGRVRDAQRYYVAVPADSEGQPTPTADELLAGWIKDECWTASRNGLEPNITGDHLEMMQTWAAFKARFLKEKSQWRRYFFKRLQANGFSIQVNNARAPKAFVEQFKEWRVNRADSDWQFILDTIGQSLSDDGLDKFRMGGQEITHELRTRNLRHKIEVALGHEYITSLDRDLVAYRGRSKHYTLEDMFTTESDLLAFDAQQAAEGVPVHQRKHRTKKAKVVSGLLGMVSFQGATVESQLNAAIQYALVLRPESEIKERFTPWTSDTAVMGYFKKLGHHGNNARTECGLYRFFFSLFGIETDSHRQGRGADRFMSYQLNAESTAYRIERARKSAELRKASKCTTNVQIQEKSTFVVHNTNSHFNALFPPSRPPKPPAPPSDSAQAAALLDAMRKENHFGNPFSKKAVA